MPHSCGVKINKGPSNKFKVIPDFLDYMITKSGKIRRVANHQRVLFERITSEGAVLVRLYRDDVPHIVSVEDLVNQTYGPEGFRYESPVVKKGEQMSDTATINGGPFHGQIVALRPEVKPRIQVARPHPVQDADPDPSDFMRPQFGWYEVRTTETESGPFIYDWLGWDE